MGIAGITPHWYRYTWTERAKVAGMPERWVLHELRQRLGVVGLRSINEHLVAPLLPAAAVGRLSVANGTTTIEFNFGLK